MNSERVNGRESAEKATTKKPPEKIVVHLDIDGTMDLSRFSPPRRPDPQQPQETSSRTANEAELRHVIRLQRQALNQQNQRIRQQRSMITRLNHLLKQMQRSRQKPSPSNWLRSLFSERKQKNETEKS